MRNAATTLIVIASIAVIALSFVVIGMALSGGSPN